MHIEHVDARIVGQRCETDRRAGECRHQRQPGRELCPERIQIGGGLRPRLLLRFAVILGGQLLDAGAKNFREQRHILRQQRAHGKIWLGTGAHRAISQVVPSLESFSTTPIAASSFRMRSAAEKFFSLRAAFRAEINNSTVAVSIDAAATEADRYSDAVLPSKPISIADDFK